MADSNGNGSGAGVWLKIGLAMLPVAGIMITVWADVRQLKNERTERVSVERIAKLESQMGQVQREVDRTQEQIDRLWARRERR
jgi:heme exporter protein D